MIQKECEEHVVFLQEALQEAKRRRGFCFPNPSVGAVAVVAGQAIARAHHYAAGTTHAEVALLEQLPPKLDGVTLYVTLEPCNHWGKTPPCVDAIIAYGITRVVFAYRDPCKHIPQQDSTTLLMAHGIEVVHCPLAEIDEFYRSYQYWVEHHLSFVTAKWAQSFDAKVAYPQKRVHLSNAMAHEFTHQQRLQTDLILSSANTILSDNPKLNARINGLEIAKPIAIIDRQLQLCGQEQVFKCAARVHIFHEKFHQPTWAQEGVSFHAVESLNDLTVVMRILAQEGYHDVWLEVGPRLMSSMHRQGLVQQTHIIMCPFILGAQGLDAFQDNVSFFSSNYCLQYRSLGDNMLASIQWLRD